MERRMFETSVVATRAPRALTLPASLTIHALVVGAAIAIPVLLADDLPEVAASGPRVIFVEPQAPAAIPPPPARTRSMRRASATSRPVQQGDRFVAPVEIPDIIPEDDLLGAFGPGGPGDENGVEGGDIFQEPGSGAGTFQAAPEPQPVRIAEWEAPSKLRHVDPVYPELARRAHIQGVVVIECVITPQGRVANATIVEAPPLLGAAARAAVLQWKYTPMIQNGVPTPVLLRVRVTFTIARGADGAGRDGGRLASRRAPAQRV